MVAGYIHVINRDDYLWRTGKRNLMGKRENNETITKNKKKHTIDRISIDSISSAYLTCRYLKQETHVSSKARNESHRFGMKMLTPLD